MKKVITANDVEKVLARGGRLADLPSTTEAIWTPAAHDAAKETGQQAPVSTGSASSSAGSFPPLPPGVPTVPPEPIVPDHEYRWEPGADPQTPEEIQRFFYSEKITATKQMMVHVAHKIWTRGYVDGNGGNLTVRVGDDLVLCTPTLVSKAELTVEHICLVDLEGEQKAGKYRRTSEVKTHLAIMKANPKAKSCAHAHPPHGTAWAVVGQSPPTCMIPEAEIFLGEIGVAEYGTPGSHDVARSVGECSKENHSILMVNHGVITWGKDVEDAYWKMETTDAYCQIVWMAMQIGTPKTITQSQEKELIGIRGMLGMEDKRAGWKECELCDNSDFRPGAVCRVEGAVPAPAGTTGGSVDPKAEQLVKELTEKILAGLKK